MTGRTGNSLSTLLLAIVASTAMATTCRSADAEGQVHSTDSPDALRCVDALYQLQVLAGDWKVYKAGPGDERTYLADRDRPAEIERLTRERDASCSNDQAMLMDLHRRAGELFQSMGPDCREAREKLQNLRRPTARSAPSDIGKQQAWIATHCPEVQREGVWLADWRYVQPKH